MKIGFFASHRGSNMQAVLDACGRDRLSVTPAVLISNNRCAEAVTRAKEWGMPAYVLNSVTHPESGALDQAILATLQRYECELIVLAGYMKMIGPRVLKAFGNRVLNIHPALLPRHGGQGMYGMNVHRAVLAAKDRVTGVSVHMVDEEYDHGRILCQTEVAVFPGDTPESLAERVLEREHELLVETLDRISKGELEGRGSPICE